MRTNLKKAVNNKSTASRQKFKVHHFFLHEHQAKMNIRYYKRDKTPTEKCIHLETSRTIKGIV